jgi:aspartyl-tRNA(Asn)/glutamyl-tRNA(Gln) amidotransferase subunit A
MGIPAAPIGAGRSSQATVTEALHRIATDPWNAFISADPEAGARAAATDVAIAAGSIAGPLAGMPIALKDIIDHAGRVTTAGSSFYRHQPDRSATVVTRLERAGAVIVGRTGLHEFAFGFSSENPWSGVIRNPWDPATSPGGSSGGSAVAVAAGVVPLALGTDTGGSVRVPAALCGCVGLKVTHGRVPLTGVFPLAPSLDTVGPITTTVTDAVAAYAAIAGDDSEDPWSSPNPVVVPTAPADLATLRVGIPHPWVDRPLAPEVAAGFSTFVAALAATGATVVPVSAPAIDPTLLPRAAYAEVAAVHRAWITEDPSRYGHEVLSRMLHDLEHDTDATTAAWRWRRGLAGAFARLFADVDLLLTPTTRTLRKEIGNDLVEAGAAPEPYRPALSWFTNLVNQAGLPALALPVAGTAVGGPPASVQLIAPAFGEERLLAVGLALDAAGITGFTPPR